MQKRIENKPYFKDMATKPTKLWFRAKRYGWGWVPSSWQGWSILAMFVFWVVSMAQEIGAGPHPVKYYFVQFMTFYIMFVFLVIVCYATGEKPQWRWGKKREEILDVLDEQGTQTGEKASRAEVHAKGLWHRASHVYAINSRGEILLQRRSAENTFRPGRWYLTAGGHIRTGETSLDTARRELKEELGLARDAAEFTLAGTIKKANVLLYGTYINNEYDDIFVLHLNIDAAKIPQKDDFAQFAWFPVDKLKEYLAGNDPNFVQYEGLTVLFDHLAANAPKN